jgi:protease I
MCKKALMVVGPLCQDQEFTSTYDILRYAGFSVEAASDTDDIVGWQGVNIDKHVNFAYAPLQLVKAERYDMFVAPGGCKFLEKYRRNKHIMRLIKDFNEQGKVIATICWGGKFLVEAGIIEGKEVLVYESERLDIENAGGIYPNEKDVCVDGNLVTTGHYRFLSEWMRRAIDLVNSK